MLWWGIWKYYDFHFVNYIKFFSWNFLFDEWIVIVLFYIQVFGGFFLCIIDVEFDSAVVREHNSYGLNSLKYFEFFLMTQNMIYDGICSMAA